MKFGENTALVYSLGEREEAAKPRRKEQETDKTEEEEEHDDGVSLDLLPWTASSIHHHLLVLNLLTASLATTLTRTVVCSCSRSCRRMIDDAQAQH